MKIIFPDIHGSLTRTMAMVCGELGYTLLLPDHSFKEAIRYGKKWTMPELEQGIEFPGKFDNVSTVSFQEMLDDPPDVFFVSAAENNNNIIQNIWIPHLSKRHTKLAYYSGNDHWPASFHNTQYLKNIVCASVSGHNYCKSIGVANIQDWLPPVDYDNFKYTENTTGNELRTYIMHYPQQFRGAHDMFMNYKDFVHDKYTLNHGSNIPKCETPAKMCDSIGTVHFKPKEGYGYAVIESMACGRPVFMHRPYAQNKRLLDWSLDGVTAFISNNAREFKEQLETYTRDVDKMAETQRKCAEKIREIINYQEQVNIFKQFIERLI